MLQSKGRKTRSRSRHPRRKEEQTSGCDGDGTPTATEATEQKRSRRKVTAPPGDAGCAGLPVCQLDCRNACRPADLARDDCGAAVDGDDGNDAAWPRGSERELQSGFESDEEGADGIGIGPVDEAESWIAGAGGSAGDGGSPLLDLLLPRLGADLTRGGFAAAKSQKIVRLPGGGTEAREFAPVVMERKLNPYSDVPSLYDLYVQASPRERNLERFGLEMFRNGTRELDAIPMDLAGGTGLRGRAR